MNQDNLSTDDKKQQTLAIAETLSEKPSPAAASDEKTVSPEVMRIDVDAVLRERLKGKYRYIPRFLVRKLERTICQEGLNRLLSNNAGRTGAEFCRGVISDLNVSIGVHGAENLPDPANRRVLFVSNHPLGGLDGMALIDFVQSIYGGHVSFVVNDLLSAVKPLSDVFLPINKHGAQSREAIKAIDDAFAGDDPMIMFPAGLVSRRGKKGVIRDLEWQKMFVTKARDSHRDVIPLYFDGENSQFFYKFAKFRKRLGLKFNIEMIRLPREVFNCENKHFDIYVGKPIAWQSLPPMLGAREEAQRIKEIVYTLRPDA